MSTPAHTSEAQSQQAPAAPLQYVEITEAVPGVANTADLSRADVMALALGSRIGVGALVMGCLLAMVLGAASLLDSLEQMEGDLQTMSENLAVSQEGLVVLNKTMEAVPPTSQAMKDVLVTVESLQGEIAASSTSLETLESTTGSLGTTVEGIAESSDRMAQSLEEVDRSTESLGETVTELDAAIGPLAKSQSAMRASVVSMEAGTWQMNDSLAYVIRILNYMTAPPTGEPFTMRVDVDKDALPPIPGLKVEADPVRVFASQPWGVYEGR